MSLFLTAAELADLTGAQIKRTQIEWLRANGWLFEVNRLGEPRVARAYLERRMVGGEQVADLKPPELPAHNFAAIGA